ncbi:MAG: hypothetical protein IKI59_02610 [Clostridia bacterium]|nr:hypothetical protein [Clostridia bacterium]
MKLTYYGTAAGEAWPGVFCSCALCQRARVLGGKNIRTRSQALIDDDLLLDLPPDNYLHTLYLGLDLQRVKALLFTHSHSDHCYPPDLELLREPYTHTYPYQLQVYGSDAVERKVLAACHGLGGERERFLFRQILPNETVAVGDYTVTALRATHAPEETCLFYRIEKGGKAVLYAHDTGAMTAENLETLHRFATPLSLVSLDCTQQSQRDGKYHMGFLDAAEQKDLLLQEGLANEKIVFVVNHFSHNGGWLHEEISARAAEHGMLASYDGMEIVF